MSCARSRARRGLVSLAPASSRRQRLGCERREGNDVLMIEAPRSELVRNPQTCRRRQTCMSWQNRAHESSCVEVNAATFAFWHRSASGAASTLAHPITPSVAHNFLGVQCHEGNLGVTSIPMTVLSGIHALDMVGCRNSGIAFTC